MASLGIAEDCQAVCPHRCRQGTGLIYWVGTTDDNMHDLSSAADLLHGEEEVICTDSGCQGNEKRKEMEGRPVRFRIGERSASHRALPAAADGHKKQLVQNARDAIRTLPSRQAEGGAATGSCASGIRDPAAVRRSEDPAAGHGEKQQQVEGAGCTDEYVPCPTRVAGEMLTENGVPVDH